MAQASWTKKENSDLTETSKNSKLKFIIGGIVMVAAIAFLVVNAMSGSTQLYKTVEEFHADKERLVGRDLRVAGWVMGDTIQYTQIDAMNSRLEFDIVDDYSKPEPKPDLLQHQAQALVEGHGDENGVFTSIPGGLMLKCPTRYEEMEPEV
jgi:cytochrome c-type biogenesis protein CcmE